MTSEDTDRMAELAHAEWATEEQKDALLARAESWKENALRGVAVAEQQRARIAELEQQMQGLRARCEGLAAELKARDTCPLFTFCNECGGQWSTPGPSAHAAGCKYDVRALVRGEGE